MPVPNGSITELVVDLDEDVTEGDINNAFREAADGDLAGVPGYTDDEIVSSDLVGVPVSSYVGLQSTNVVNSLIKLLIWYDNEYGFSSRMLDIAEYVTEK